MLNGDFKNRIVKFEKEGVLQEQLFLQIRKSSSLRREIGLFVPVYPVSYLDSWSEASTIPESAKKMVFEVRLERDRSISAKTSNNDDMFIDFESAFCFDVTKGEQQGIKIQHAGYVSNNLHQNIDTIVNTIFFRPFSFASKAYLDFVAVMEDHLSTLPKTKNIWDSIEQQLRTPQGTVAYELKVQEDLRQKISSYMKEFNTSATAAKNALEPKPPKYTPTREEIIDGAIAFREEYKRLPANYKSDGNECLPENSVGWSYITSNMLKKEGTSLGKLVAEFEGKEPPGKSKKLDEFPTDEQIAIEAIQFKAKHGRKPNLKDEEKLEGFDIQWKTVLTRLYNQDKNLINIIFSHKKDSAAQIPEDEIIVQSAISFREKNGVLPRGSNKKEELPENSQSWGSIYNYLQQRNITLGQLVAVFEGREYSRKGVPSTPTEDAPKKRLTATPLLSSRKPNP